MLKRVWQCSRLIGTFRRQVPSLSLRLDYQELENLGIMTAEEKAIEYADKKLQVVDPELWQTGYSRYRKMSINVMDGSDVEEAFEEGATWQRNSVWHDSDKEQPEGNRTVVVWNPAIKDGEILTFCVEVFEHRLWAYIEDILPTEILKFSNS